MGKGGTKFEGEAIGVRGKDKYGLTAKQMRKNMEVYKETGVHPELERRAREAAADAAASSGQVSLPAHDPHRPFVFWDVTVDGRPAGRLVVELFEDLHPAGALHLRGRSLPGGGPSCLKGCRVHRVLPGYALFLGRSPSAAAPSLRPSRHLHASELGAVAVSNDGAEVAVALGRSLALDATHQVVGRVHSGLEALKALGEEPTGPDDAPIAQVRVARCGATDHLGTHEPLDDAAAAAAARRETPAEAAERLARQSADTKASIL